MPDQNNRNDRNPNDNKGGGDRNRKNLNGLIILIGWALVLTVGLNWLSVYLTSSEEAKTTCEISYSEFKELVREGVVEEVLFVSGQIRITTEEGYVYTDEEGNQYDKNYTLFTMQLNDPDLLTFLDEHDVADYGAPYVPEMPFILEFMVGYILPGIISGLRVSVTTSLLMLNFAELMGATHGMGYYIQNSITYANYTHAVAGIVCIGLVVTVLNALVGKVQARAVKWRE